MIQRGPDYEQMAAGRIHDCVGAERRIAALEAAGRAILEYYMSAGADEGDWFALMDQMRVALPPPPVDDQP